jgi:hypothetical protein
MRGETCGFEFTLPAPPAIDEVVGGPVSAGAPLGY